MSENSQETEVKFYVLHLDRVVVRLGELGAQLVQPRILETNLRFDLPDRGLTSTGRVLRLRYDTQARLTYKGAGQNKSGVLDREEIEFIVEDHHKARQFLEALGFQKSGYYEKYRTTYELSHCHIMLDELPYGNFVEIEGEIVDQIQSVAAELRLDWGSAVAASYMALFDNLKQRLHLPFQELSFENFTGIPVTYEDLGVRPADE